jgi:tRNA threonylcarbamoyladenosine biosynthesis protein TsaE
LGRISKELINSAGDYKVWLFHGEMGAGKTTFIKAICNELGVEDTMSSPTFSIVNEYRAKNDEPIFHFDFYRIQSEAEALDIGTDEYLYSGNRCLIEWPERILSILPPTYAEVFITVEDITHRTIAISIHA